MNKIGTYIPTTQNININMGTIPQQLKETNCRECMYGEFTTEEKTVQEGFNTFYISSGSVICIHKGNKNIDVYGNCVVCSAFKDAKEALRKAFEEGR